MDPADKPRKVGFGFYRKPPLNFPIPSADHQSRISQLHGPCGQAAGGRLGIYNKSPISEGRLGIYNKPPIYRSQHIKRLRPAACPRDPVSFHPAAMLRVGNYLIIP